MAFSPDSYQFVTGSYDGVALCDIQGNKSVPIEIGHDPEVDGWIHSLQFSPDGKTLAVRSQKRVVLWDLAASSVRAKIDEDWVTDIAYHPHDSIFATAGKDAVRIWNAGNGKRLPLQLRPGGSPRTVEFSPDGKQLAVGDSDGDVTLWNSASSKQLWRHHIDGIVPIYIAHKFQAAMFAVSTVFLCIGVAIHCRSERRSPETDSQSEESG
ncbi:hypothetical protein GC176_00930 [bacterium]|nr:hypothetical protein [bacterium]